LPASCTLAYIWLVMVVPYRYVCRVLRVVVTGTAPRTLSQRYEQQQQQQQQQGEQQGQQQHA
jgi:hypothetical protein